MYTFRFVGHGPANSVTDLQEEKLKKLELNSKWNLHCLWQSRELHTL